jgi:ubiquitin conjugation factor E4 B
MFSTPPRILSFCCSYACDPSARLLHSADDTRLNAESEEVKAWFAAEGPPQEGYSFICECFFMTARALQLGLGKGIDTAQNLARTVRNWEQDIEALRRWGGGAQWSMFVEGGEGGAI